MTDHLMSAIAVSYLINWMAVVGLLIVTKHGLWFNRTPMRRLALVASGIFLAPLVMLIPLFLFVKTVYEYIRGEGDGHDQ